MRRRTLLKSAGGGGGIEPSKATACDVCLYDKRAGSLIIVPNSTWSAAAYPASNYEPIGVVVVPGSHNVYGTGECGVMSLKSMNCSTPNTGATSESNMYWGGYGSDISTLTNFTTVNYVGSNGTVNETVQGTNSNAYLPSDNYSTVANPYDTGTYYKYNDSDKYAPSPYKNDGSFNTAYSPTLPDSSANNALSDFDGIGNTSIITGLATAQSDWKTASNITNNSGANYYPAACCCWRYSTSGTKQGDWYLPACGELGYIMPRLKAINTTIAALLSAYGTSFGVQLSTGNLYWSSSEHSSNRARNVYTGYGFVDTNNKNSNRCVRAFLRVGGA